VSARFLPRTTLDVDLAVDVEDDAAAESLVHALVGRGYQVVTVLEHDTSSRMATVRLVPAHQDPEEGVRVDLLFASCGIEPEVARDAEAMDVIPGLVAPVARIGHLVAMKLLAVSPERPDDAADLRKLLKGISHAELTRAREAIALIEARGFNRGKSLEAVLNEYIGSRQ
jgi:hypothetical protein